MLCSLEITVDNFCQGYFASNNLKNIPWKTWAFIVCNLTLFAINHDAGPWQSPMWHHSVLHVWLCDKVEWHQQEKKPLGQKENVFTKS